MDIDNNGIRFKRSTARNILLVGALAAMMCGTLAFSFNFHGMDISEAPVWVVASQLERLRFTVAICGAGLIVMGIATVIFVRSRDDRTDTN